MRRGLPLSALFLAAAVVAAAVVPSAVARAEERPRDSLSGVLELPAAAPQFAPVKDPFRSPIVPQAPPPEPSPAPQESELPALLLTAVMQGSGGNAAIVNGVILRPGDAFMDMQVLEIGRNRIVFRRGEGRVTIFMQELLYNQHSLGGK